ncbi:MAG: hypothetical protein J6T10_26580 [Methanobrevibacter sp.]|nr:hypothetical protein [Methanobrevibacter sp.]
MKVLKIIEAIPAKEYGLYYPFPELKNNEYYAPKLKKGGFIRPTNGEPYLSKDKGFFMNFDKKTVDVAIVELEV